MSRSLRRPRAALVLLTALCLTGPALLTAGPAGATEDQVTLDVLKVVDGDYVVSTVSVAQSQAAATEDQLQDRPDVVDASPEVVYQPQGAPSDPYWEDDDPQAASAVADVWSRTQGAGEVVAVLDTGVDGTHPDLAGALVPGTDTVGGADGDEAWHGTGVAGVIAARADNGTGSAGMAPQARIMPIRVCNDTGCPSAATARGILWAVDHGADVINMSLAGPGYSDVLAAAVGYALDHHVSVVASAGNDGDQGNPVMYPAANSGVIAVSATDPTGAPAAWAEHGWQADIATVGEDVVVPYDDGSYAGASGTSFSGPAVAGAVALLRASHPGITPDQVQADLEAGVDSSGTWDPAWGAGRLSVPAAMAAADAPALAITATPSSGSLALSWPAAAGATGYQVRVDGVVKATVSGPSATVTGLTDGTQVAVDVQPAGGQRSRPVLATVAPTVPGTPVLQSATMTDNSGTGVLTLSATVTGTDTGQYSLVRDGDVVGTVALTLGATPTTVSLSIGATPTYATHWQLRAVGDLGLTGPLSNTVVTGSGQPAAPAAPTGLTGRADGSQVLLSWDDLGSAYSYRVTSGGSTLASPRTAGATLTGTVGQARSYAVAVVDAWGQTGPAATVSVTPTGATAPAAPTAVTAVAGTNRIDVSWSAAVDNGSPVTGYTVTASPNGPAVSVAAGTTSATLTGLTNGFLYDVTVTARNAVGTGPSSTVVQAAPTGAPVPGAPRQVLAQPANGGAEVSWLAPADNGVPVTGYTVTAGPGGAVATTSGGTSAFVGGLRNGTAYTFTVTATNAAGTGPVSATSNAVTPYEAAGSGGAIAAAYEASGSSTGPLGTPLGDETCGADGGCAQQYTGGAMYWTPTTGAHWVRGAIQDRWTALGGARGVLGYPVTDEVALAGGAGEVFQGGSVYFSPATGAHAVWGALRDKWASLGWQGGFLGYPTTDATNLGNGWAVHFQGGSVYWSASTGAHAVWGALRDKWASMGWQGGSLGYPTTDATNLGNGWAVHFQGGSVYWSASTGAHAVWGALRDKWASMGWQGGSLGYPTTDATNLGNGWAAHFQGGSVYFSPASTGAHAVWGALRDKWASLGWQGGFLGYPTTDATNLGNGWAVHFQGGSLYWSPATGAHTVGGAIRDRWAALGWQNSQLGYPASDEYGVPGGRRSDFQRGSITWTPSSGAVARIG